jgi:hypothetical protein
MAFWIVNVIILVVAFIFGYVNYCSLYFSRYMRTEIKNIRLMVFWIVIILAVTFIFGYVSLNYV